jgi:hypothetical protein
MIVNSFNSASAIVTQSGGLSTTVPQFPASSENASDVAESSAGSCQPGFTFLHQTTFTAASATDSGQRLLFGKPIVTTETQLGVGVNETAPGQQTGDSETTFSSSEQEHNSKSAFISSCAPIALESFSAA